MTKTLKKKNNSDTYFTPMSAIDDLIETGIINQSETILEPCAGTGNIIKRIKEAGHHQKITAVELDDDFIPDLRSTLEGHDRLFHTSFLWKENDKRILGYHDLCIMNPPFSAIPAFIEKAMHLSKQLVCLLRMSYLVGVKRGPFYKKHQPTDVYLMCQRPIFHGTGSDIGGYIWCLWNNTIKNHETKLHWIQKQ